MVMHRKSATIATLALIGFAAEALAQSESHPTLETLLEPPAHHPVHA